MTDPLPGEIISADRLTSTRTLYDAGAGEIFWRNFLAGASRALGTVVIYLIFLGISLYVAFTYVWPQFQPLINTLTTSLETLQGTQQSLQQLQGSPVFQTGTVTQPNTGFSNGTNTGINSATPVNSQPDIGQLYQLLQQQPQAPAQQ